MRTSTFLPLLIAATAAKAAVTWYAVDPMSERRYMPDTAPVGGLKGDPVRIVVAQGEYEPGSFVLTSDTDEGKVDFAVSDLKAKDGAAIPASEIDLATVKVWYQAGNAWFSYFQDTSLKLCPELLLHDEDLVKVDEFRTWFCEYISLGAILALNGDDKPLAERQLRAILADFVRHNETIPSFARKMTE